MTRLFFDTEFIEDGHTIDLVSIGVVRDDGATFYAESSEADLSKASDWVRDNVLPHLDGPAAQMTRAEIATSVIELAGTNPEFWAYYADYDWVALCQLYGRMIDLPPGWPMYCHDLRQWLDDTGRYDVSQPDDATHHALADAKWVADTRLGIG
jgi:hypothetical protein